MSNFYADAPFRLGETYAGTDSSGNLINTDLEGLEFDFPMTDEIAAHLGVADRTSGRFIRARIFRNTLGSALLGKRLCEVTPTSVANSTKATSYADELGKKYCFPVDPYLPSAGVADDDLFYVILRGPTTLLTPQGAGDIEGALEGGDLVMCSADAQGRVTKAVDFNIVSSAGSGFPQVIGTSLGAAAADATDTEVVIDIALPWA